MGSACSCHRQEVADCSFSSCRCYGCRCCGMCVIVHPSGRKRGEASSFPSASQSAGQLDRTAGILFPAFHASSNFQYPNQSNPLGPETHGSISLHEEGHENLQRNSDANGGGGLVVVQQQTKGYDFNEEKQGMEDLSVVLKKTKGFGSIDSITFLQEDLDNCPICLEEYDVDNPKIDTECEHRFHLSCILEWMERSDSCPICDKEMVFSESL